MTFMFLAILAVAWMLVFLPAVLRATQQTPLRSAEHFRRGMEVISPGYEPGFFAELRLRATRPAAPVPGRALPSRHSARPAARPPVRVRATQVRLRRNALAALLTMAGWSAIAALFLGGGYWELHIALDALAGLYVAFLIEERRRRVERAAKVRRIGSPRPQGLARPSDVIVYDTFPAVEEA